MKQPSSEIPVWREDQASSPKPRVVCWQGHARDDSPETPALRATCAQELSAFGAECDRIAALLASRAPLNDVLDELVRVVDATLGGHTVVFRRQHNHLRCLSGPRFLDGLRSALDRVPIDPQSGACGAAAHLGQAVIAVNSDDDPARAHGLKGCWAVPVFSGNETVGTLAVYRDGPERPSVAELARVEAAAQIVRLALVLCA
jgi:GAF domain-containing protein